MRAGILPRLGRWFRIGIVPVALAFAAYGLVTHGAEATDALSQLAWWSLLGAVLAAAAAAASLMFAWRVLLAGLGSPVPVPLAIRILFVGQLGKYIPGAVWGPLAVVELGHQHGVPRARVSAATVLGVAVLAATGLSLAPLGLAATGGAAGQASPVGYAWLIVPALLSLGLLHPRVLGPLFALLARLAARRGIELSVRPVRAPQMAAATGLAALSWVFSGLHVWLLIAAAGSAGPADFPLAVGAYALAWSAGLLLAVAPSGIGPRDATLLAILTPVLRPGAALVVMVVSRLVTTAADLLWGGVAVGLGRLRPGAAVSTSVSASVATSVAGAGTRPGQVALAVAGGAGRRTPAGARGVIGAAGGPPSPGPAIPTASEAPAADVSAAPAAPAAPAAAAPAAPVAGGAAPAGSLVLPDLYELDATPAATDRLRAAALRRLIRRIAADEGRALRVLDVGCGEGGVTRIATELPGGHRVVGVDWSAASLTLARRSGVRVVRAALEGAALPFADGAADVVIMSEVVEHLLDTDAVLAELHRVLRPGGHLVLTTPNLAAWFNRALLLAGVQPLFTEVSLRRVYGRPGATVAGHLHVFTHGALREFILAGGFTDLRLRGIGFHEFGFPLSPVDRLFARLPRLAALLIAHARKPG